jgi:hypothetical protein
VKSNSAKRDELKRGLERCEDLFFSGNLEELARIAGITIQVFPGCVDAYVYRGMGNFGIGGDAGTQKALNDYFVAIHSSDPGSDTGAYCRLCLKLLLFDTHVQIQVKAIGEKAGPKQAEPLYGGCYAMLSGKFILSGKFFQEAIASNDRIELDYAGNRVSKQELAYAGLGLTRLREQDVAGAKAALGKCGDVDARRVLQTLPIAAGQSVIK